MRSRGVVLIAALMVLALLGTLAAAFVEGQRVELRLSRRAWDVAVARQAARSGITRVMGDLAADTTWADAPTETWLADPSDVYARLPVGDAGFAMLWRHDPDRPDDVVGGCTDECGKVNLNTAPPEVLAALPGMTAELAAAIVDWRDPDEEAQPDGAEAQVYLTLGVPYRPRNAPFESVEELLLIYGVTSPLLYGEDVNRNGLLDPCEDDGDEAPPADNRDGVLDRGLFPFVTVWSLEMNTDPQARQRLNLNSADADAIRERAGEALAPEDADAILMARTLRGGQFATVADLLDVPGISVEKFRAVADLFALTDDAEVEGRINVNTAPREVLLALPGMDDEVVDALLAHRASEDAALDSVAWPLEVEPLASEPLWARYRALSALITVRASQLRVEALGFTANGTFARLEAVVDRRNGTPAIVWQRDASGLGLPAPLPTPEELDASAAGATRVRTIGTAASSRPARLTGSGATGGAR